MRVDAEYLRRHYASLSDDGLLEIDRSELVEEAQTCYDVELANRRLRREPQPAAAKLKPAPRVTEQTDPKHDPHERDDIENEDEPEWIEEAACACAFPTSASQPSTDAAVQARDALENAGIPCYLTSHRFDPPKDPQPRDEYRVMVPGKFSLEAVSVLDKEIFNVDFEAAWQTHFEMLSDEELRGVDEEQLFGGMLDRIERVRRAYAEELKRRKLR